MLVTIEADRVCVRLSRRNLAQLKAILDDPGVAHGWLARKDECGVALVVHAEEDADHYGKRDPAPGLGKWVSPPRGGPYWRESEQRVLQSPANAGHL